MPFVFRLSIICLLLISTNLQGQKLYENKFHGPYLLLYKLTPQQVDFLAKNPAKIDSQYLFTQLVGKVSTDSIIPLRRTPTDKFPVNPFTDIIRYSKCSPKFHVWDIRQNGYFLEVSVNSMYIANYRLIENPLFNAGVHTIGYETFIFVEDTAGLPVYNATVHLDTAVCPFDSSVGGYKIKGKNISGILKIERGDQFTMTNVNGYVDKTNNTAPPKDNYQYSSFNYEGYLVTNKPRYKHWDTLFFKSFLVNENGKPIKRKLIARLYQNSSGYAKQFKLKPTHKGAYDGYFVINDSFTTDQEMILTISNKYGIQIKSQTVILENYELKDIRFELKADKQLVTPGAGIKFFVTATTANRLPIMDGKLTFKMKLTNVNFTDADSVVIPFAIYENWYSTSVQTDPSGVTVFDIPDSVFMALDGAFTVKVSLLTADNESREVSVGFNYQTTRDRLEAALEKDTLYVNRLYNMKSAVRQMRIKIWSRKDILIDSLFHTPLRLYIPPNIYLAQIFSGDTLVGNFYRQTPLPEVWGKRTHDSIHINIKSPFDIPVFYRIYANNKLVASGHKTALTWHAKDSKKRSYHIQYGILEGSVITPRFYSKSFHLAEKELKVEIIQPETVYPGQEVAIEIMVTNAFGKPVKKVNLAAWAVNTQMEGIVIPDVPYLGLVKTQKPLPTKQWPLVSFQPTYQAYIKNWQIHEFLLRKNEIFKLVYPTSGFEVLTDTTPLKTTEIEFYAHGNYSRQNIVYVKANDTLIFSQATSPKLGVQRIKPGKYNFTIRTFNHIYNFKDVEIIEGKKNFVCLQPDSLAKLNIGDTLSEGVLKPSELDMLYAHTFLFRYDGIFNDTFIIKVNGKVVYGIQSGYSLANSLRSVIISTNLYNPDRSVKKQTTMQEFFLFGQVKEGDELELLWKNHYAHIVKFQPGYSFGLTSTDQVRDVNDAWTKEIKFIQRNNTNNYVFNAFWWDPLYKDTARKIPPPVAINPPTSYHNSGQLEEFQYRSYSPAGKGKVIYNSLLNLYLSNKYTPLRIWLFERQDSTYSILENYQSFGNSYANIGMNARRNMWTIAPKESLQNYRLVMEINDSTWIVKNINIDSSVHLFLTLKPEEFRKLGKAEYIFYDRLVKHLTRDSLNKWVDTPSVNKGLFVIPIKKLSSNSSIEGTVIGPGIKYPVNNAFVVLEKDGFFVRGAVTNNEGRFQMDNIDRGIYMLKIRAANYNYWIHYKLEIDAGYYYLVQAEMKPYAWITYYEITYQNPMIREDVNGSMAYSQSAAPFNNQSYLSFESKSIQKVQRNAPAAYNWSSGANSKEVTIAFGGNRTDETRYMVDGVATIGINENNFDTRSYVEANEGYEMNSDSISPPDWSDKNRKAEDERLNKLAGDNTARRTRKDFKDYAYWIPNLYTNKQGKAGFSVRYPDNVTSWRTFVPAMDWHRHTGLGELTVRSYKPIVTSMALPFFLTEGDSLMAYGRVMNYTSKSQNGKYSIKYNKDILNKEIDIKDVYTDSLKVIATKPGDTLHIEAAFELPNGYRDAEMRKIQVNAATVITGQSMFAEITKDTTFLFKADSTDIGMDIAVYNQKLSLILEILGNIEMLPAYDNRSVAAYLNALLIKKSVCKTLGIPFKQERQIREAMGKLKRAQSDNGLFSWFKGGKQSFIVSSYAAEVMFKAHQMGYENNTWLNAARNMETIIPKVSGNERLEYLLALKKMKRAVNYDSFTKSLKPDVMDRSEKLEYWRLMQLLGKKIPLDEINGLLENTMEGNLHVAGTWNWRFAPITDDAANTYKAWEIMFDANAYNERRKALVEYLATECSSYGNSWIKAAEAMMAEMNKDSTVATDLKPEVYVNGQLVPAGKLPAIYHLFPGQTLTMTHKGSPVYVATNRQFRTYHPKTDSSQFDIKVTVPQISGHRFTPGVPVDMKVTVFAKRNQYNSVIEIPIPAGCVYGVKIQGELSSETHREYKTDRVLIFSDDMPFGYHTFTIRLVPRFTGTFYTAPARSALMFYPDKAAFTPKTRWTVRK